MKNIDVSRKWIVVLLVLISIALGWYSSLQTISEVHIDQGLKRSLSIFAAARAINGVISMMQGTVISFQPLGMGLNMAVGQILLPVRDFLDAFSAVMLAASVAFGIQKILLLVGSSWIVSTILSVSAFVWGLLLLKGRQPAWLSRFLGLMLFIRFVMPVAIIGSNFVFQQFLEQQYVSAQSSLSATSNDILRLNTENSQNGNKLNQSCRIWDLTCQLKNTFSPEVLKSKYDSIKNRVENSVEKMISLIVIFLVQTILIPLILVWFVYKISFSLVSHQASVASVEMESS